MGSDAIVENYKHGQLLSAIKEGLAKLNISPKDVTIDALGPVDEFHIGSRVATAHFTEHLHIKSGTTILDVGCGLGGPARYVAQTFKCKVEGIDLCEEYIETGKVLNEWVHLNGKVNLTKGSALDLPFADGSFDGAYQIHVGMNIEKKDQLFAEVYRVLKPGAYFGIYDIVSNGAGDLQYPVPWAATSSISHLATLDKYKSALKSAGFTVTVEENRKDFALDFFKKINAKAQESGKTPPLGLHTLMQASTPAKLQNMVAGIADGKISPFEIVAKKA